MNRARTTREMLFAASLDPCPFCKARVPAQLDLFGAGDVWQLKGPCSRCEQVRQYTWHTEGNPNQGKFDLWNLGDERPSQIIRPGQFIAELDRQLPLIREEPETLEPIAWNASAAARDRVMTCLNELLKFTFTDLTAEELADRKERPERYDRAWLKSERDRLLALNDRYNKDAPRIWALEERGRAAITPMRGAVDRASLMAHEQWLRGGRKGAGRLDVVGFDASGLRFQGVQFQAARLERVRFDRAVLEGARMMECELHDISAREANAISLQLMKATVTGGGFERAVLSLANFDDAVIDETSFEGANLDRTQWPSAKVTAASFDDVVFGNSQLDHGRFRGCTFRRADFRKLAEKIKATTAGAVFEDCDLRGTKWDGRNLDGATFVRCKLYGITGKAGSCVNVTIEDPDISPDGDGGDIGEPSEILAVWR